MPAEHDILHLTRLTYIKRYISFYFFKLPSNEKNNPRAKVNNNFLYRKK